MTDEHHRRAARMERRAVRQAERDRRRGEEAVARLMPGAGSGVGSGPGAGSGPDPGTTLVTAPYEELRRRRTFKLVEHAHAELVCAREGVALQLFGAARATDEREELTHRVEALNDEIDDLRALSDELLHQVQPVALDGDALADLERVMATAQGIADPAKRAAVLRAGAARVLAALDDALDPL